MAMSTVIAETACSIGVRTHKHDVIAGNTYNRGRAFSCARARPVEVGGPLERRLLLLHGAAHRVYGRQEIRFRHLPFLSFTAEGKIKTHFKHSVARSTYGPRSLQAASKGHRVQIECWPVWIVYHAVRARTLLAMKTELL